MGILGLMVGGSMAPSMLLDDVEESSLKETLR